MKVLIATAMYPTAENPAFGSFVRTQAEALRSAGLDVQVLVLNARPRKLLYAKGIFQIRKRLNEDPSTSVIHAHYSYVGVVARTQWKVPVVVTFHGDDLLGTVTTGGGKTLLSPAIVTAGLVLGRMVEGVVVQTQEMAEKFGNAPHVHVIPHEIDFDTFQPVPKAHARQQLGLSADMKYLLFAADPAIPVKRFALARAVADELCREVPAVELITVFKEPQSRLALYMSACDVLVFPSYQEGSPNIVKQAMACNLPIVSTDVGDVREIIGGTAGCYICPPQVSEWIYVIKDVITHFDRTRGRENVQHLAGPKVARSLIRVYEQALSLRPSRVRARTQDAA